MFKLPYPWMRWLPLVAKGLLLVWACTPRVPEIDEIDDMRSEMRRLLESHGAQSEVFMTKALMLARKQEDFAKKYPNHPSVPRMLVEAAEIYGTYFGDAQKAVQLLRIIDLRFRQKSPVAPKALFYEAFLYETMLNDTAKARQYYEDFLQYYPEHELAKDARLSLQNLGKSPEEVIEKILKGQSAPAQ